MSQNSPRINDLLETVRQFIDDCAPRFDTQQRYQARVASYLLSICERELRFAPGFDSSEAQALGVFLNASGTLDELRLALCRGIRAGNYDDSWNLLLEMVLRQTVNDVQVVRPDHLADIHVGS